MEVREGKVSPNKPPWDRPRPGLLILFFPSFPPPGPQPGFNLFTDQLL